MGYVKRIQDGERIKFTPAVNQQHAQLELWGGVKADAEGYCVIRNRIYEQALNLRLRVGENPEQPLRRMSDRSKPLIPDFGKLRQALEKYFDDEELKTLCFDIGEDYDSLPAQGKAGKCREVIKSCERKGRIPELVEWLESQRPKIDWDNLLH